MTDLFSKMSPSQRRRYQKLVRDYFELKADVLEGVSRNEPRLRQANSSLHPQLVGKMPKL